MGYRRLLVAVLAISLLAEVKGRGLLKADAEIKRSPAAQKRNLAQFGAMIKCTTGRLAFAFTNYGNYCGRGGSGVAVDALDRCCKVHDECYGHHDKCKPYYTTYVMHSTGSYPHCKLYCNDDDPCRQAVCVCDKEAAECFAKRNYNPNNNNSWLSSFF